MRPPRDNPVGCCTAHLCCTTALGGHAIAHDLIAHLLVRARAFARTHPGSRNPREPLGVDQIYMQSAAMKARALRAGRGEHGIEKFDSEASALGLTTQSMWHTSCKNECQRFEQMYGKDETKWPSLGQGPDHCTSAECAALKVNSGQSTALASALASAFAHGETLDATTRGRQQQKAASGGDKAPAPDHRHVYSAHWIRGQHAPGAHSAASGEPSTCGCGGCPPCPYGSLAASHLRQEASAALGPPQLATATGAAAGALRMPHPQQHLAPASRSEAHAEAVAETEAHDEADALQDKEHAEAEDREREREREREFETEREREKAEREREREKAQAEERAHAEVAAAMIKDTAHKQASREAAATQLRKQHAARAPAPTDAAAFTHALPVNVTADAGRITIATHAAAPVRASAPEHPLLEWICTSAGGCQAAAKASFAAAQAPRPPRYRPGAHGAGRAQEQEQEQEEEETDYKEEMEEEEEQQQQQLRQGNAQTKDGMQATNSEKSST
jgi:hypothetical protein